MKKMILWILSNFTHFFTSIYVHYIISRILIRFIISYHYFVFVCFWELFGALFKPKKKKTIYKKFIKQMTFFIFVDFRTFDPCTHSNYLIVLMYFFYKVL